ncbi:MAG: hypothetical protein V3S01_06810 [Dehalococcoidia bacterium]
MLLGHGRLEGVVTADELYNLRVRCYWNLHRKCWSVRAQEGPHKGKVVAHCTSLTMDHDVRFLVSQKGRKRVLSEGRKNVHAFVEGQLIAFTACGGSRLEDAPEWEQVRYNPFECTQFERVKDGVEVGSAMVVVLFKDRSVYALGSS